MASTWSALKIELLETGQNSGQWGNLTNINLGDAVLGEAITGSATVDFASDADVTITLTDFATTQAARNLRLNITESSTGIGSVRNLILGSGCQIEKFYLINNTGTGAKTVKNTAGTGISVPAGKATLVYNNGTNVVDAASYFTSLTLGSALPVASGGTGITSFGSGVATFLGTPSSANLAAALTDETGSGSAVFATSPTLVTPNLGTPTTLVLTSATGLPLSSGVTGILPVANGGTATATPALVQGTGVTITGTWPNQTINATGTGGTVTSVGGTGTVNGISLSGSVTTSGSLTLGGALSGVNLTSQVTGTLPAGNGGTGVANNAASTLTISGAFATTLTVTGTTGVTLPTTGTLSTLAGTETLTNKTLTSPTLTTPALGTPASGVLSSCTVDGTDAVGFRNIPQNSQSAAYTLVLADAGKHIFHPVGDNNARTFTIPANSSVAYPVGTAITFINMAAANVTIAITTDTLTLSPAGTAGSRTLATNGSATCIKITSTQWLISGSGLT